MRINRILTRQRHQGLCFANMRRNMVNADGNFFDRRGSCRQLAGLCLRISSNLHCDRIQLLGITRQGLRMTLHRQEHIVQFLHKLVKGFGDLTHFIMALDGQLNGQITAAVRHIAHRIPQHSQTRHHAIHTHIRYGCGEQQPCQQQTRHHEHQVLYRLHCLIKRHHHPK